MSRLDPSSAGPSCGSEPSCLPPKGGKTTDDSRAVSRRLEDDSRRLGTTSSNGWGRSRNREVPNPGMFPTVAEATDGSPRQPQGTRSRPREEKSARPHKNSSNRRPELSWGRDRRSPGDAAQRPTTCGLAVAGGNLRLRGPANLSRGPRTRVVYPCTSQLSPGESAPNGRRWTARPQGLVRVFRHLAHSGRRGRRAAVFRSVFRCASGFDSPGLHLTRLHMNRHDHGAQAPHERAREGRDNTTPQRRIATRLRVHSVPAIGGCR